MNKDKYVFAQLVEFLDCFKFRRIITKYNGDRYVKHLTYWNQFLAMMFGQLANRESLRDLNGDASYLKMYFRIVRLN